MIPTNRPTDLGEIFLLLDSTGRERRYFDQVNVREHALQAATHAAEEGARPALIAASLMHDIGHLMEKRTIDDAKDYRHEDIAAGLLASMCGPDVTEPVRLHVAAKRYLCATEATYFATLSRVSMRSLELQGGPFSESEANAFIAQPFAVDAVRLRRWDDMAKVENAPTMTLAELAAIVEPCLLTENRRAEGA